MDKARLDSMLPLVEKSRLWFRVEPLLCSPVRPTRRSSSVCARLPSSHRVRGNFF